jgi:hypothetical protein
MQSWATNTVANRKVFLAPLMGMIRARLSRQTANLWRIVRLYNTSPLSGLTDATPIASHGGPHHCPGRVQKEKRRFTSSGKRIRVIVNFRAQYDPGRDFLEKAGYVDPVLARGDAIFLRLSSLHEL